MGTIATKANKIKANTTSIGRSRNYATLIIDETGDRKKGETTDYVKRQYIGNLGKIEKGIVAVTAYGLVEGMTFPLIFEVSKPKEKLREKEPYLSKPHITVEMIRYLREIGLRFKLVLADSL